MFTCVVVPASVPSFQYKIERVIIMGEIPGMGTSNLKYVPSKHCSAP
jgi:hypothetical protein